MVPHEAKKRIEALKREINHHRYRYHVLDKPEISDAAWDSLKKELADLEEKFPQFVTPDSPTRRVGGKPLEKFAKVRHPQPMLSFNDAFVPEDMAAWEKRFKKLLAASARPEYFCELKIDGLAIELIYKDGALAVGATRGDGTTGEDVTQNLKTIEAIPLVLRGLGEWQKEAERSGIEIEALPKEIVVRGEVFMAKRDFRRLNKEQEKKGGQAYANPRNVAAGSIRQLDPKITASRRLDSFAYAMVTDLGQKTHEEEHTLLKLMGFKTNPENRLAQNLQQVEKFHAGWAGKRDRISYEIDGIVVIVNQNDYFGRLGVAGKAPRGAIAYKFAGKEAATVVEDIEVSVGRTGALTPVARLRPVSVGGITITHASLHNEDEIGRLGLKIGDTVIVQRAGDVIPRITRVLTRVRTGKERVFSMPEKCPLCGSAVIRKENEVARYCSNPECFGKRYQNILHFVSKNAFDIEGLGEKIVEQLLEEGLIKDAADLFTLTLGDIEPLERFAEKSAKNLVEAIGAKKNIVLPRFLVSLSIRHVGEETAIDLARHFGTLEKIMRAGREDFEKIPNVGSVVARSITGWFKDKGNRALVEKLKKAGVKVESEKAKFKSLKFKGLTFVFTGELETMTRGEAQEKVRELGGDVSSSVSKNTDYVVAGESPGSKFTRAQKLGVKIIGEEDFLKLIQ